MRECWRANCGRTVSENRYSEIGNTKTAKNVIHESNNFPLPEKPSDANRDIHRGIPKLSLLPSVSTVGICHSRALSEKSPMDRRIFHQPVSFPSHDRPRRIFQIHLLAGVPSGPLNAFVKIVASISLRLRSCCLK